MPPKLSFRKISPLNPDDLELTRRFLLPIIQRAYPGILSIGRLSITSLGSVQHGRGVTHLRVQLRGRVWRTVDLYANYDQWGGSQAIYRFLRYLAAHGFSRGRFRAPRPLTYSPRYRLLVYESFAGRRIRDELEAGRMSKASMRRTVTDIAGWLRKFHSLPPRVGHRRNLTLSPPTFAHLTTAHRRLLLAAIPPVNLAIGADRRLRPVHGDPHLANCIRGHGRSLAMIDYSESYLGNPLADVAMFLVHLDVALQKYFLRPGIAAIQQAFVRAYFGRTVWRLPLSTRRLLVAYQVRTAATFLRFTSDHNRRPAPGVRWMMRRFERLIASGTASLEADQPWILLAS